MFECTRQVVAAYFLEEKDGETLRPVLAWDDAGKPYVLGQTGLELADSFLGFLELRSPDARPKGTGERGAPVITRSRPRPEDLP